MAEYRWRSGFQSRGADPAKCQRELERIRKAKGDLTPNDVLAAAQDKKAELHKPFEWDDVKAAVGYRLLQARRLVRAVFVVKADRTADPGWIYVPRQVEVYKTQQEEGDKSPRGVYKPVTEVVKDLDEYQRAASHLLERITAARQSLSELERVGQDRKDKMPTIAAIASALETARQLAKHVM
jgi:hypothetical protein